MAHFMELFLDDKVITPMMDAGIKLTPENKYLWASAMSKLAQLDGAESATLIKWGEALKILKQELDNQ